MSRNGSGLSPRARAYMEGTRLHHNLPAPSVIVTPRASCMDSAATRARFAIRKLVCEERGYVEGVIVERTPSFSKHEYYVQKAKDEGGALIRYTLEGAVEAVVLIMQERERRYRK